jgi:TonB family protein
MRAANFKTKRPFLSRMSGPLGSFFLHGSLLALFFHFNAPGEVFGQRAVDEQEWIWLPEVTVVAEPPPPAPVKEEAVPPPPPISEPAVPPEEPMPVDSVAEDLPAAVVADPAPAPPPEVIEPPSPEPVAEPPAATHEPDVWTEVRTSIMKTLRYPTHERRNGIAGVVNVTIRLDEAGQVAAVKVTPPAPAKPLCDAVLAAVRRAGPFPAVGEAIRQGQTPDTAEIAIRFKLEDSGL